MTTDYCSETILRIHLNFGGLRESGFREALGTKKAKINVSVETGK